MAKVILHPQAVTFSAASAFVGAALPDAWMDDDDATRSEHSNTPGGTTSFVEASLPAATVGEIVSIEGHIRFSQDATDTSTQPLDLSVYDGTALWQWSTNDGGTGSGWVYPGTAYEDHVLPFQHQAAVDPEADVEQLARDALAAGSLLLQVLPNDGSSVNILTRVAELHLVIVTAGIPPHRIYPRDDGLFGSAPRNYPSSKTRQRGNRIVGGYF